MKTIYLDQAATSFPKAPGLGDCMKTHFDYNCVNINRSSYKSSTELEDIVLSTREALCTYFNAPDPSHVVFTSGITHSLNLVIKGYLNPGDHCLISPFEHNAVVRPLHQLLDHGITYDQLACDSDGYLDLDRIDTQIQPHTKMMVITHASNVFGNILPIEALSALCQKHNIALVLDTAQTAGHLPIDFTKLHLCALTFTGHKGLLGPQGIGGIILEKSFATKLTPLLAGGTGSASHLLTLPTYMPDKFESGTLNIGGIVGLYHALKYIESIGTATIHAHEMQLTQAFIEGIAQLSSFKICGHWPLSARVSTVSIQSKASDIAELSYQLEQNFKILTRCGLHCAPLAHQAMETYPEGTLRFSFGYFNTLEEVALAIEALKSL